MALEPPRERDIDSYRVHGVAVRHFPARHDHRGRPPIVLVHGGNHAGWVFDQYAGFLAEYGFDAHVLDWYHHGNSAALDPELFIKRGIADVAHGELAAVVDSLGVDPIVIGHSMGALAALVFAAERPVQRLVLMAPVPPVPVDAAPTELPVDFTMPFPVPPFEQAKAMFWQGLDDEHALPLYERLEPESPRAVWEATRYTQFVDLDAVDCPALMVAAELDTLIPASSTEDLGRLLAGYLVRVPNVGHSDLLCKPGAWKFGAEQVIRWLMS